MELTFPSFDELELQMLQECLESKWVTQGPFVKRFQKIFSEKQKAKFTNATTSCTAALHLAALALGLKESDEMICPAFTWVTSANTAEYVNATVKFVDVNPNTFNIDPSLIEKAITPKTKAIMAVHLFGLAADMDPIIEIAKKYNLFVIEDAACAVGSTYKGTHVGTIGEIGCFSFHPRKVITTGEGGMLTSKDEILSKKIASLLNHGASGSPSIEEQGPWTMANFPILGYNLRLSDIQAAVGVAQIEKLDSLLRERRKLAINYINLFQDTKDIICPPKIEGHTYQSFVIRIREGGRKRRNSIMRLLSDSQISTRPGTHAVHNLEYYAKKYNLKPDDFPNATLCEDTTITIPLFPGMSEQDQCFVVTSLKKALKLTDSI